MVQRTKREGSTGLLGGFTGILALGLVLGFGCGGRHPLQIAWRVFPAVAKRLNVIQRVPTASSSSFPGSWAWIRKPELMFSSVGSQDATLAISSATFAAFGSKARQGEQ